MRKLIVLAAMAACLASQAYNTNGIAYGRDGAQNFPATSTADYKFWVGCVDGILEFREFLYLSKAGPGSEAAFTGTRLHSFTAYTDPFFGKVADFVVEGLYGSNIGYGRLAVARFRVTDSDFPGKTFGFYAIDIYLPGNLNTAVFSRTGITGNRSHVLIALGGVVNDADAFSEHGMAWGEVLGTTHRGENAAAKFNVADNYLFQFLFGSKNAFFRGDRVRSFRCTNNGLFGKQADFWLDGRLGTTQADTGRTAIAHVILTKTAFVYGSRIDLLYIAVYHPLNLTTPMYERVVFITQGQRDILCK